MKRERRQNGPRLSDIERTVNKCAPLPRFRLVQDDSCHWYVIPAGLNEPFERWSAAASYDEEFSESDFSAYDFDQYRLGLHPSSYTFTDLKEDE